MNAASSTRLSTSGSTPVGPNSDSTSERPFSSSLACTKASPSHLYAQQLNNSAVLCIEIGQYSRAITSLQKALELNKSSKKGWKDRGQEVCKCYKCTLDACIAYSESTPSEATLAYQDGKYNENSNKRRKVCRLPKQCSAFWKPPVHADQQNQLTQDRNSNSGIQSQMNTTNPPKLSADQELRDENGGSDVNSGGYVYRRPIRIRCEGHAMGSTLYLIVTFNLALAHHLQTVRTYTSNKEGLAKAVNRTLVLYELTYKWQLKLLCARDKIKDSNTISSARRELSSPSPSPCTAVTSIRFNMMIRNNLSQIHRLVGNHSKHKRCLEHLLSTVMVVTEYKSRAIMNRVVSNSTKDPRQMEIDGFLQNTTSLILREGHCANAA